MLDRKRNLIANGLAIALTLALLFSLAVRAVREHGGTNSYALVAQALLAGKPYVNGCYDTDCARFGDRTYIVFPPVPAFVAMPMVAAFGVETKGFLALSACLAGLALLLWWRIFTQIGLDQERRAWLIAAIACASPLYYVLLESNNIWFFAQAVAFFFLTLAIHEALARRLMISGAALACAMLSRQMSILYAPILLLLALQPERSLRMLGWPDFRSALRFGTPVLAGGILYLLYNAWRFGNPLDSGYSYITFPQSLTGYRFESHGLWSIAYLPFNALYMFFQGFHATFAEPEQIKVIDLDRAGTSILAASPWLLFLFFTPIRRKLIACSALVVIMLGVMLFYHSNGFAQFNTQRYTLDWLPAAWIMLGEALRDRDISVFRLLVLWGMLLNVAMIGVMAMMHAT